MPRFKNKGPKRASNPSQCFMQSESEKFQAENPGEKKLFGEFTKECGNKWKNMTNVEKEPFQKAAEKDLLSNVLKRPKRSR